MKPSKFVTQSLLLAGTVFLAPVTIHAQVAPGPGGSIVGQPPSQGGYPQGGGYQGGDYTQGGRYIIGQPPSPPMPAQPSVRQNNITTPPLAPNQIGPVQSGPPPSGLMSGRDPMKERLNRANREGADLDRNGIISPEEATTIPQSSP